MFLSNKIAKLDKDFYRSLQVRAIQKSYVGKIRFWEVKLCFEKAA